ncbi:MAG: Bug family tripartite tricarboxylate transporter substrate binding protein [Xanthobacteraceae bacterium]
MLSAEPSLVHPWNCTPPSANQGECAPEWNSMMRITSLMLAAAVVCVALPANGGSYPEKSVQIIADSAAGSTPDVALRFFAEELTARWGQQVIVINKPGAGGSLGARAAAEAVADGYTLYQPVLSTFVALRPAASNIPLQVPRDFLPIGFVAENPMFFAVSPKSGIATVAELIALAKKHPGEISYATTGVGRLTHLAGELLQHQAQIELQLVPYTGGPSHALSDLATGRVGMIIEGYSGIAGAVQSGAVKLIGVASANRLPQFSMVPTMAETIPGFLATGWGVLVAPVGTSPDIIEKVNRDLQAVGHDPVLQRKIADLGSYARPMSVTETVAFIHQQQNMWNPVLAQIASKQAK